MGPQHPSTHGVLRVVLRLDGERVVGSDIVIGYLHRGIEKLCEHRDWAQIILLTDRMDYVAAASNNLGYCETVEKLMSLEVPRRARYIRTILAELQRIASHCLWLGTHAMDLGAMTVFLYAFRERELDARSLRGVLRRAADLQRDADRRPAAGHSGRVGSQGARVLRALRAPRRRVRRAADPQPHLARSDARHRRHRRGGGDCHRPDRPGAARLGRGAGCPAGPSPMRRTASSSSAFRSAPPATPTTATSSGSRSSTSRCGSSARRSTGCPKGRCSARCRVSSSPPAGETYHAIESPKGELGFFIVSDGKSHVPYRFRVRPPSFCNLQALPRLIQGHLVSDVVALIGSIDIVVGEVDR